MKVLYKCLNSKKGFSLFEIVAVLLLLVILAAVAIPKYIELQQDAAKGTLKRAAIELNARENIAWAKYKSKVGQETVLPTVGELTADFDDFTVTGASSPYTLHSKNFAIKATVERKLPNDKTHEDQPYYWKILSFSK